MKINTILKKAKQMFKLVSYKKYIVRSSDGTINVFNLSFLGVAALMLLCLVLVTFKAVTYVEEDKNELIKQVVEELYVHVEELENFNTVLKTNVDYHTHALTIFQANPYVLIKDVSDVEIQKCLQYFSKAAANKVLPKAEYETINEFVLNKKDKAFFPKVVDLNQLEDASLLGSYLRLEFFKSKVMVIEANFVKEILTLTDSIGEPVLTDYSTQAEYDEAANNWLDKANKIKTSYEQDMLTIAEVIELLMQTNTRPVKVNHPLYRYRDIMQVALLNATKQSKLLAINHKHF